MDQNIFLEESNIPYYRITSLNYNLSIFKLLKMNKSTEVTEMKSVVHSGYLTVITEIWVLFHTNMLTNIVSS